MAINDYDKPLVSVAITTCERPVTLKQTLLSVVNQTHENIEIFVVDDCSENRKVDLVMQEFTSRDSRIHYFPQATKGRIEENVNFLINKAKGKYFLYLNDDDWIDEDYIEKCVRFYEKNDDHSIVIGKTKFYKDEKFAFYGKTIEVVSSDPLKRLIEFHDNSLGSANCPNFGLIKTDTVKKVKMKNVLGHDNVWVANLSVYGKIKTLDEVSIHRRLGGSSESLKKSATIHKYSMLGKAFPFISLWFNLVKDILVDSYVLKRFNFLQRISLAINLTLMILFKNKKYLNNYKQRKALVGNVEEGYLSDTIYSEERLKV